VVDAGVASCQCRSGYQGCAVDGGLACSNQMTDVANCGSCGNVCTDPLSCSDGKCICVQSETVADCHGDCADLSKDPNHCGSCNAACNGPGLTCTPGMDGGFGTCECEDSTLTACPDAGCVDLTMDPLNCGCCGNGCLPGDGAGTLTCLVDNGGSCNCPGTTVQCAQCGTCVDTNWDPNNCGGCGGVCPPGVSSCDGGMCFCDPPASGFPCEDGTCPNIETDVNNCGGCGIVCQALDAPVVCRDGGVCFCGADGTNTLCPSGNCADLQTDVMNCGTCGHGCFIPTPYCVSGSCTAQPDGG
jgi:hypothetical protein